MKRVIRNQMYVGARKEIIDETPNFKADMVDDLFTSCMLLGYTPVTIEVQARFEYLCLDHCFYLTCYVVKQGKAKARKCYWEDNYPCLDSGLTGDLFEPKRLSRKNLRQQTIQDTRKLI